MTRYVVSRRVNSNHKFRSSTSKSNNSREVAVDGDKSTEKTSFSIISRVNGVDLSLSQHDQPGASGCYPQVETRWNNTKD